MKVLYLAYWGAAEPLGQALILPAVTRLADAGVDLTLVTFDKPSDLDRADDIRRLRARLEAHGIRWVPLRYHKRPKVPATAFDVASGCARALLERLRGGVDVVHARTFIGGLIGLCVAPALGARLVYHNEGFYPDEQVDGGVWAAGSRPHRVAKRLERLLYESADGVVALSHRAKREIDALPGVARKRTPVVVVPSCVDLETFRPTRPRARDGGPIRFSYIGSIGGRYSFDLVARFVAAARSELGDVDLRVLTGTDPEVVAGMLRDGGVPEGSWSIDRVPHVAVPAELETRDAGLFFLARGLSEHACSPTKVGEYWASGLPIAVSPNVSDTGEIIAKERVGVVVDSFEPDQLRASIAQLAELIDDPDTAARCRRAASAHYGLDAACARQLELYRELTEPSEGRGAAGTGLPIQEP